MIHARTNELALLSRIADMQLKLAEARDITAHVHARNLELIDQVAYAETLRAALKAEEEWHIERWAALMDEAQVASATREKGAERRLMARVNIHGERLDAIRAALAKNPAPVSDRSDAASHVEGLTPTAAPTQPASGGGTDYRTSQGDLP